MILDSIHAELVSLEKEMNEEGWFLTSDPRLVRMRDLQNQLDELEEQYLRIEAQIQRGIGMIRTMLREHGNR